MSAVCGIVGMVCGCAMCRRVGVNVVCGCVDVGAVRGVFFLVFIKKFKMYVPKTSRWPQFLVFSF